MSKMSTAEAARELGIDMANNPSIEEIKKAYKRVALIWHPDKNEEDTTAKFQRIAQAYDRLKKAAEGEDSDDDDYGYGGGHPDMDD
eukprot:CAMPEP_0180173380 /NCGR_PEP_ID=MMETSP0986-20121125/35546_1 /TAXON_ID=697907 /ORGANISM="non described non described, Strain CCMP2293" /LENGTH=85 /DNA_ID=CAMNT_0022125567 /DNA_START=77 /DNA_END=331 /DNA_ORIENTATION=-